MSVGQLLLATANRFPDKEAVVHHERRLTYQELAGLALALAGGLAKLGVRPKDRVLLDLPNLPEFVVAWFATTLLGATVVPLNPLYKPDEVGYILKDSGAVACVTVKPLLPVIQAARQQAPALQHIVIVQPPEETPEAGTHSFYRLCAERLQPPQVAISPQDVAACLYTSGTTGRPKGAMLSHRNLVFDAEATLQVIDQVTEKERFLCVLPLFHSFAAMVCMLVPVKLGATSVLMDRFLPQATLETIARERVTVFPGVPAMYGAILATVQDTRSYDLSSLWLAVTGGSAMPAQIMRAFEERFGITVLEGNGPTETSPVAYCNPLHGVRKLGSVGLPIPGVRVRIVDDADHDVPPGEVGEIVVQGENVMQGYWNNPEATQEALRGGWLHTGDLGRMDEDGYIYIVDRKKDMIIVGGLNVYPREVEETLFGHPAVADAAVVGEDDPLRGEVPVAFVVLKPGAEVGERELIRHCQEHLANFKCPRRVVFAEALPKNITGKVLKGELREQLRRKA